MSNPLRSLAARITLLVFLASVLSSLTVTWVSVQSLDGFLRSKIDQHLPQVADRISNDLDQWYSLRARELEVFAGSPILIESAPHLDQRGRRGELARKEAELYLRYVLESFPQFDRLAVATLSGHVLAEVGKGDPLEAALLAADSEPTRREGTSISGALQVGESRIQIASASLRGSSGRALARLHAIVDLDQLATLLWSEELGENAMIFLVDREGHFVNPPEGLATNARFERPEFDPGREEDAPFVGSVNHYDNDRKLPVIGTLHPFTRFGWTLVVEQPYDEAFAPVIDSLARVAGLNLAIVIVVGLLASRIARSIIGPLRALSAAARRLSEGEREVEIPETQFASDEVNLLTRTFNEMSRGLGRNAREIEDNQREIEAANAELLAKNNELSSVNLVLEQLSITDGLTKLHNHRYFQEALTKECKRSLRTENPLCLVLIDIDYFKKWNDRLGHAGGDAILRRIAEILNESVRETDLLARYGGEEFAILAIATDLAGAVALGEKVRQAVVEADFVTDVPSEKQQLTVSVGVAAFAGDRRQLFADADAALYQAKDEGRNRVIVAPPRTDGSREPESERAG